MSRWREPQPRSTAVITPDGYAMLNNELQALWVKRKEVNAALSAAAAEGDRSENAEYIYRKKQQGEIDRKIRYLQKRLPDLRVIDQIGNKEQIFFGAYVELERESELDNQGGNVVIYRIVGPDETDADKGWISIDSPLAKALLKKYVDDEVTITLGDKRHTYLVNTISYTPFR
jgi:transcription elongation factor GreB